MGKIKVIKEKNLPARTPAYKILAIMAFIKAMEIPMEQWMYWTLYGLFSLWFVIYLIESFVQKQVNLFKHIDKRMEEYGQTYLDLDDLRPKKSFKEELQELNQKLKDAISGRRKLIIVELGSGRFHLNFQNKVQIEVSRSEMDYFKDTLKKSGFEIIDGITKPDQKK